MSPPDFLSMNETDVREIIVRPLLARLGYQHGTEANIRTEQTFRYEKAFLGRKNPQKDPPLTGRADYILEVTSYGRWVVEVKPPSERVTRDSIEQAHTYAAHPEVAALFFVVTNGREFQLYRTSSLDTPLMSWKWEDTEEVLLALSNLVGPEAIKRKVALLAPDAGKPLAAGVPSKVKIIGGYVRYDDHKSSHPFLGIEDINGLELPITSGLVDRAQDGRIHARVNVAKSAPMMRELNAVLQREDDYEFFSSDEFISTDRANPTILQNFIEQNVPTGTPISLPVLGRFPMPFGFRMSATTEAIGYVDSNIFQGTMQIEYRFHFDSIPAVLKARLEAVLGPWPREAHAQGGGAFEVELLIV